MASEASAAMVPQDAPPKARRRSIVEMLPKSLRPRDPVVEGASYVRPVGDGDDDNQAMPLSRTKRRSIVDMLQQSLPSPVVASPKRALGTISDLARGSFVFKDGVESMGHTPGMALASNFILQLQLDATMAKLNDEAAPPDDDPRASTVRPHASALRVQDIKTRVGDWSLDVTYRRKNLRILINAMFGLCLALLELYVSWMNKIVVDADNNVIAILDVPTPPLVDWLKMGMTATSIVLMLQIADLYRLFFAEKYHWERKVAQDKARVHGGAAARHRRTLSVPQMMAAAARDPWFDSVVVPVVKKYALSPLTWCCLLEMAVVAIHPPPFVDSDLHLSASCLMFFRLYLFARVYRDYSKVYRQRRDILLNCFLQSTNPSFDWFLSIKIDFAKSPLQFILVLLAVVIFILTISIHVFEREQQPILFTLTNSAWYTFCTLSTHGLLDMQATSLHGRFVTAVMLVWGITLETMSVVAILHNFGLNDRGRMVSAFLQRMRTRTKLEDVAARVMTSWWRWKRARHVTSPADETRARSKFWHALERLGPARSKQRLLDEDEVSPVLEQLTALEANVARLRHDVGHVHACLCRHRGTDAAAAADVLASHMSVLMEKQAILDEQNRTISFLLAKTIADQPALSGDLSSTTFRV
ncbi:Aste57867_9221 [Aphanomyces stellatus]|uniref:Aste57867_9221 protein n=1 Tax=Aphanomyces stellatus TaxID=120398 RepID=A0A485KMB2_9STRA|nr:hypothetical protein As57867_009185 [Aphanomyces stellatus]VFT86104.1 Aste57867_9221 [Aphanomyces stellatus]